MNVPSRSGKKLFKFIYNVLENIYLRNISSENIINKL